LHYFKRETGKPVFDVMPTVSMHSGPERLDVFDDFTYIYWERAAIVFSAEGDYHWKINRVSHMQAVNNGKNLVLICGRELRLWDVRTKEIVWKTQLPSSSSLRLYCHGKCIYVFDCSNKRLFTYDVTTGGRQSDKPLFAYVRYLPQLCDGMIVLHDRESIYAHDSDSFEKRWQVKLKASYRPVAYGSSLVVVSGETLYRMNIETGRLERKVELKYAPSNNPCIIDGKAYYCGSRRTAYAIIGIWLGSDFVNKTGGR